MLNGHLKTQIFLLLDSIREKHKVMDKDWAVAAGLGHGARISELRALAEQRRDVPDRAFHYMKFLRLITGLTSILGEDTVRKELVDQLAKTKNKDEKLALLTSILSMGSETKKDQAISFLEILAAAPEKK